MLSLPLPPQTQLYTKLRSWEHAACLMHVSAWGNNKVCHKLSHLLKTCASRTDSSSEHVLTEMPIVLTSPSNVIRTKMNLFLLKAISTQEFLMHYNVRLIEQRRPASDKPAADWLRSPSTSSVPAPSEPRRR